MTAKPSPIALADADLAAVTGAGFFGDVAHVAKRTVQEVGHYGGVVVGAIGDMTVGGGRDPFHKLVPRLIDRATGRK